MAMAAVATRSDNVLGDRRQMPGRSTKATKIKHQPAQGPGYQPTSRRQKAVMRLAVIAKYRASHSIRWCTQRTMWYADLYGNDSECCSRRCYVLLLLYSIILSVDISSSRTTTTSTKTTASSCCSCYRKRCGQNKTHSRSYLVERFWLMSEKRHYYTRVVVVDVSTRKEWTEK